MDTLRPLLDRITVGDPDALDRAFVAYEPYLRLVVRRQLNASLRAKFDSVDVVQSIWADLLSGFRAGVWHFDSPEQLRNFLVRATQNRLTDRVRREGPALRLERPMDAGGLDSLSVPRPSTCTARLEAEELWERLLTLCAPQHRGLLALKRQGISLAEIAARTGLHESSVRRILYDLAARLASEGR
jgi:RNA polymerase sigma-70 factor (ECF subfamily)